MKPVDQEFINIEGVQYGDCMRACIASLMELPIKEVPHFLAEANGEVYGFWEGVYDFCESMGYEYVINAGQSHRYLSSDYHLIGGPSPRGRGMNHICVGREGQIVHDPHPDKNGLVGDPATWVHHYLLPIARVPADMF